MQRYRWRVWQLRVTERERETHRYIYRRWHVCHLCATERECVRVGERETHTQIPLVPVAAVCDSKRKESVCDTQREREREKERRRDTTGACGTCVCL